MCDSFLHPRPAFSTYLRSDVHGEESDKRHRPLKRYKHSTPFSGQAADRSYPVKKEGTEFHPIYTPLLDTIAGTPSAAIEANLEAKQSRTSSGGFANFYETCNISKPPNKSTPSSNSRHQFVRPQTHRPQTAPARIADVVASAGSTPHQPSNYESTISGCDNKHNIANRIDKADAITEELMKRHKCVTYDKHAEDIAIASESEDGQVSFRIVCGQMVPKMQVFLPPSQSERDALELKTRYTSVTHRTMEEVPWQLKSAPTILQPTREPHPDMIRQRPARYETEAHAWQSVGPSFDRLAPRKHTFSSKPISYMSENKQTQYIPGYTGQVPLVSGELGSSVEPFIKRTDVRRDLPPATRVSRQANITGYSGYVRPGTTKPAHYLKPCSTQSLTHRDMPVGCGTTGQIYPRTSAVSKLVTLTHPYNPYNKLNPAIIQRA